MSEQATLFPSTYRVSGARFSPCRIYRYALMRVWAGGEKPHVLFVMLNPSTADETENDPTIERCVRRAVALGCGGITVANLFALRSTDPVALRNHPDPIGPENDVAIREALRFSDRVICAWGAHGSLLGRDRAVCQIIGESGKALWALRINGDGTPAHPLYLPYSLVPELWGGPAA